MRFWDSSALVPLLVAETDTAKRTAQLREDSTLTVWWGTILECESALQRRFRDGSLSSSDAAQARAHLSRLAASWLEVTPSVAVRRLATRLLRTHPLRTADSLQLAAALSLREAGVQPLCFLTSDTRLAEAADIEGLTLQ